VQAVNETRVVLLAVLPGFLFRGGFAVACGGLIGIERERRGKPAGFRTNILICLGATIYMMVGELIVEAHGMPGLDPTRIAAQVVSGIGFLGAGTILHSKGGVTGLTSAATIWVVAAIGLVIGAGFPGLGLVATVLVFATLELLTRIEPKLLGRCRFATVELEFDDPQGRTRIELSLILAEQNPHVCRYSFTPAGSAVKLQLSYCESHPAHHSYLASVLELPSLARRPTDAGSP